MTYFFEWINIEEERERGKKVSYSCQRTPKNEKQYGQMVHFTMKGGADVAVKKSASKKKVKVAKKKASKKKK